MDGQAAAQAAERQALEALRWDWDTAYRIGRDDEHGWYAARLDRIGALITADDPDVLQREIAEDYAAEPVPRKPRRLAKSQAPGPILGTDPGELLTESSEP